MHLSLEVIAKLSPDDDIVKACNGILKKSRVLGLKRLEPALKKWEFLPDSTKYMLAPDWRVMCSPEGKDIRKQWKEVWFKGEAPAYAAMTILYGDWTLTPTESAQIDSLLERVETDKLASQAMIYYLAIHWLNEFL